MSRRTTILTCPLGHEFKIPTVVYGYPSAETFQAADRGDVTIGGCLPDLPVERPCPTCGLTASYDPAEGSGRGVRRSTDGRATETERPI